MQPARRRRLKTLLDELVASQDRVARRASDPVEFVHAYADAGDREVVGLLAATLAFGNVVAVKRSIARVLAVLGERPARAIELRTQPELAAALATFRHRVYGGADVATMLANAASVRRNHGSLGGAYAASLARLGSSHLALAEFADSLRGRDASRGLAHLVPDPRKGSASKRLWLYLRWMVRADDGVDVGLWPVSPSTLLVPVDTHVLRIGQNLGLTKRTDASLRTAEEITASLRMLDAEDPVRYDFALCHLGVSRACPSRREDTTCRKCVLRTVCLAYARGDDLAPAPAPAPATRLSKGRDAAPNQSRRNGASLASSRRSVSRPST